MKLFKLSAVSLVLSLVAFNAFGAIPAAEIEKNVISVVKKQLDIHTEEISKTSDLENLGADTLDLADIAITLEKQYSISLSDSEIDHASTVNDFAQLVAKKTK